MRIDLPNERAASGSFLAPNSNITTTARIAQCHGLRLPTLITSRRPPDATAARLRNARARAAIGTSRRASGLRSGLVGPQRRPRGIPYTLRERFGFKDLHGRPEAPHQPR